MYVCIVLCIYIYMHLYLYLALYPYIYAPIHLYIYTSTPVRTRLYTYRDVCLPIYLSIVWHHSTQILEACPATNSSDQEDLIRREHLRRPDVVSFARSQSPSSAPQSPRLSPVREMQERCCFPDAVENFCGEGCSAFSLQVAEGSRVK